MSASRSKRPIPSRGSASPRHAAERRAWTEKYNGRLANRPGSLFLPGWDRIEPRATNPAMRRLWPPAPDTLSVLLWQQTLAASQPNFENISACTREFFPEIYAAVWPFVHDGGRC